MTTTKKLIQKKETFKLIHKELTEQFYKFNSTVDDMAECSILQNPADTKIQQDNLVLRANLLQSEISRLLKVYKYRIKE